MDRYIVEWEEQVCYRAIVNADSPDEAIEIIKDGSQPFDTKSTWSEWDDHSFSAEKKD